MLHSAGVDETRLNAELLLAHILAVDRLTLASRSRTPLDGGLSEKFRTFVQRRIQREPIQYILGETEFMGLRLFIGEGALIPRPETEVLVEKTLDAMKGMNRGPLHVLDIGTGSGNIAISLVKLCPYAKVTGLEISSAALEIARRNVTRHSAERVELMLGDIFSMMLPQTSYDLVVSNPPYVAAEEFESLQPEIRCFEPRIATTDDADGFRFLRRILDIAPGVLRVGGVVLVELAFSQADRARKLAAERGLSTIVVHEDLSGVPRVLEAWQSKPAAKTEV
jgi:release factor glutamine methyltransferase